MDLLKKLGSVGFVIADGNAYYKGFKVLTVINDKRVWFSKHLSLNSHLYPLVTSLEGVCSSSTVGNFSISGEIGKVGDCVLISDMHYARLLVDSTGYYVEMKEGSFNDGYLYSLCDVLRIMEWHIVEEMVDSF